MSTILNLEKKINESYLVVDTGVVRLLCAMIIANRLPGDPVWLFLVAPPSGLKTELINALDNVATIRALSTLTPKTFASGARVVGAEPSLLLELQSNKIITFKDFTTILQMNYVARDEILSQLREIYDGKFKKRFGNGVEVHWEGKLGFLAGVTDAIESYQDKMSVMGERFIQYRIRQPDRKEAARKGLEISENIIKIRQDLKQMFAEVIEEIVIPDIESIPKLSKDLLEELIELSEFATTARAGVQRDMRDRDITNVLPPEMPVRFAKQLILLSKAFLILGRFDECEREIIQHIAMSSVPRKRRRVLMTVMKPRSSVDLTEKETMNDDEINVPDSFGFETPEVESATLPTELWTAKDLGIVLGLPTTTARRTCEELTALGLMRRIRIKKNLDGWQLEPRYQALLEKHYSAYEAT